jgi:ATP-dependent DNA ligase
VFRKTRDGIALNARYEAEGAIIYKHASALGCEGIVSKRLGSTYRAGRSVHWLKVQNPDAPVVKRLDPSIAFAVVAASCENETNRTAARRQMSHSWKKRY